MYIKISMAMTADGKTADAMGRWMPLCPYEKKRFYRNLEWADAILVGERTVVHSNISFLPPESTKKPVRVVVDGDFSISNEYKVFKNPPTILLTSCNALRKRGGIEKKKIFEKSGVEVTCIKASSPIPVEKIVEELDRRDFKNVLVVGGGDTNWEFMKKGFFNEYQVTVTPYILGGKRYTPVGGKGFFFPGKKVCLHRIEVCPCGEEVVLYYYNTGQGEKC
jgi:2,5-diamino-6-(ribosylamino)-4(3H)-pyrimidinone 5'-phosphate reductase